MNSHQVASDSNGRPSQTNPASQPLPTNPSSSEPSCFFKVIDVDMDGKNAEMQGECYSQFALVNFWASIPEQRANTIRVILHNRSNEDAPFKFNMPQEKNPGYYSCTYEYYQRPDLPLWRTRDFHLPTLRRMLERGSFAQSQWYSTISIKKHSRHCGAPFGKAKLWDLKYEQCRIFWAVDQRGIDEGKLVGIQRQARMKSTQLTGAYSALPHTLAYSISPKTLRKPRVGMVATSVNGSGRTEAIHTVNQR